ncbi:hypothetical protein B0J15DRAFT_232412 [Fusarium solani]|jgi:hypothetical protein|uniref:Uncharacterized protein n=1 Tax=Fusarium solani TaxID=169388 RepID=A0A9P9KUG0_FUSSL|nr:uncharacterized protein B0J15DRAFT_232412 [Fusarium solani]KAH7268741.1 hypothetical protein B0J15DRAFT_232412 [Fusarium solani]
MPFIDDNFSSTYAYGPRRPLSFHNDSYPSSESHIDESILPTCDSSYSWVNNWGLQEDDEGHASVLLSFACIFPLIFPEETLKGLNHEADGRKPDELIKYFCSKYSNELGLGFPEISTRDLSMRIITRIINKIINGLQSRRRFTVLSCEEFEFTGRAESILQRVDNKGEELPRERLTTKGFAINIGYLVGKSGRFVYPGISMGQIIQIATILPRRE